MQKEPNYIHKTVLLDEAVEIVNPTNGGVFIDATLGGGGHTRKLLESCKNSKVIAFDWDLAAIENAEQNLKPEFGDRLELVHSSFTQILKALKNLKIKSVDGILADFGTSQNQIDKYDGFSFMKDRPLDMRMSTGHFKSTAEQIIAKASQKELEDIFFFYGEERFSRPIARKIVLARQTTNIKTTFQLAELVKSVILPKVKNKKPSRVHPATKIFQALRIAVNQELENINIFLNAGFNVLKRDGIMACITFHSLEDRIVKNFFKQKLIDSPDSELITKRPIIPCSKQILENNSCRSSKLRAIKK